MSTASLSIDEKSSPNPQSPVDNSNVSGAKDTSAIPPLEDFHAPFKPGKGFMLAFASICIITLAAALDATSLSIALPIITVKLKGSAIEAFWSGTSFLVTSAVFQPVIAGLSHVFGRKQMVLASALFFAVGSIVAAVAKNFTYM
jgi:predicted MFS family arabinose efflux permease